MDIFLLIAMGVIIGVVSGLLGVGAGILSLLALAYYIEPMGFDGYDQIRVIMANNALLMGFFCLAMAVRHLLVRRIPIIQVLKITFMSIPAALFISWLIVQFDWFSPSLFYLVFCLGLFFSVYTLLTHTESSFLESCKHRGLESNLKYLGFGTLSGIFQGFTSTESSTLLVPFLNRFCDLKIEKAIAAAITSIAPTLLASSFFIFSAADGVPILWSVVLPLAIGTITGFLIPFGALSKVGLKLASYTFSFFLLIIAIRILFLEVFYF